MSSITPEGSEVGRLGGMPYPPGERVLLVGFFVCIDAESIFCRHFFWKLSFVRSFLVIVYGVIVDRWSFKTFPVFWFWQESIRLLDSPLEEVLCTVIRKHFSNVLSAKNRQKKRVLKGQFSGTTRHSQQSQYRIEVSRIQGPRNSCLLFRDIVFIRL